MELLQQIEVQNAPHSPKSAQALTAPSGSISLSESEANFLRDALRAARSDIWQTMRVSEMNLTGRDPAHGYETLGKPDVPMAITRQGVDESNAVHSKLIAAMAILVAAIQSNK